MNAVDGLIVDAVTSGSHIKAISKSIAGIGLIAMALHANSAVAQSQSNGVSQPVSYKNLPYEEDRIIRKLYGGVGLGMSMLEPDTSDVPGVDNKEGSSAGAQFMIGLDVNKWMSVEGHVATLGEAELTSSQSLGYQTFGASALAYVGKGRHRYNRHGLLGFARLGYGFLKNDPSDGLAHQQVNGAHLLFGGGLEYALRNGIGVRAEAISFDTDAQYMQLSVLYRIGRRTEKRREMVAEAPPPAPVAAPKPAPVIAPVPAVAVAPADTDVDGVRDSSDRCPNTQPGVAVDGVGCALFSGVIEGVNFNSGSADLTASAQGILNGVVSTLTRFPTVKLSIMAHTDSQGDTNANKQLSKQRARSVAVYLVKNGVGANRLKAYGFGEERPIDTNETSQGRLRNRRVEFQAAR